MQTTVHKCSCKTSKGRVNIDWHVVHICLWTKLVNTTLNLKKNFIIITAEHNIMESMSLQILFRGSLAVSQNDKLFIVPNWNIRATWTNSTFNKLTIKTTSKLYTLTNYYSIYSTCLNPDNNTIYIIPNKNHRRLSRIWIYSKIFSNKTLISRSNSIIIRFLNDSILSSHKKPQAL